MTRALTTAVVSQGMAPMLELALDRLGPAAAAAGWPDPGLIVVDNASEPPLCLGREALQLLRLDVHHSFAAACNIAMRAAPAAAYLMLNNDLFLHERALAGMRQLLDADPRVGIVGTRLVYPDGTIQHAGIRFGAPETGPYHADLLRPSSVVSRRGGEWQAVTGACMLLRHDCVAELGGFDESFPFAWEDVDFCLRARQRGWKVVCDQAVDSLHLASMTPGRAQMDPPSREVFLRRWAGKWTSDA